MNRTPDRTDIAAGRTGHYVSCVRPSGCDRNTRPPGQTGRFRTFWVVKLLKSLVVKMSG
jgi:hypothetical protein